MKIRLIAIMFLSFIVIGCHTCFEHPCSIRNLETPKRIIVFIDIVKGNERIFTNHFMPKIRKLLKHNESSESLFALEVYPITKKSSGEEALVKYTLTEEKSTKICE